LLALGALGLVGLVGEILLRGPRRRRPLRRNPRRRGNPWITMRGHHVLIDDEGRIERGAVPQTWRGVHVRDVSELERRWSEIDAEEEDCAATEGGRARATFRTQDEALRELYDANPHLSEFVELEAKGQSERAYQDWVKGGRRGPKPRRARGDGRFDAINEGLERRGARAVASWSEAVRAIVPPTKRWEDFAPRLPFLEDATGLRLNLPAPAEELELGGGRGAECEQLGEGARERLLERARGGRLTESAQQDDVPF
jgi:hypothetical protein